MSDQPRRNDRDRDGSPRGRDGAPRGRDGAPRGRDGGPRDRDGAPVARRAPGGLPLARAAPKARRVDPPAGAFFMSVETCKGVMTQARRELERAGVDPDQTGAGVPIRGIAYRAMTDIQSDPGMAGLPAADKVSLASGIVSRFYLEVARREALAATHAGADRVRDGPDAIGETPVSRLRPGDAFEAACDPPRRDVAVGDPHREYSLNASARGAFGLGGRDPAPPEDRGRGEPPLSLGAPASLVPRAPRKRIVSRYLLVNGYDRDWVVHPSRYSWAANIAAADSPFTDVRSLAATCLIIPREVYDEQSSGDYTFVPKTNYRHAHGLPFPFLILNLANFQNVYKSTSAASSKAFAHFVFHSFYSSPNGRDYIRLEPIQGERLTFDINPLAQLAHLTLSIQQPSGEPLNDSRDDHVVKRIRYADATATFNQDRRRLLVELTRHFDKNEFFRSDTVRFAGFDVPTPEGAAVNAFINRPSGHRIVDMLVGSQADDMVDGFYIQVMGDHDPVTGAFENDADAVQALLDFNDALDAHESGAVSVPYFDYTATETAPDGTTSAATRNHVTEGRVTPGRLGSVINSSLQCTASFRLEVEEDDVTTNGTPPFAGEGSFSPAARGGPGAGPGAPF